MPLNLPNPRYNRADKRKINEVSILNYDDDVIANAPKGPRSKRIKTDHPKSANTANKQWDLSMEMPQGKTRLHFTRDFTDVRISGNATTDDPEIVWLGRVPDDAEAKRANEYIARQAALKLNTITHVYIIYGTQSRMFVDRDRKRVHAWHVDDMKFKYRVLAADPHMFLAFGTGQDHINLYGYVHVTVDQKGNPTDFATSRNADHVVDGDDRIFELFEYDFDQGDCSPYCPTHAKGERDFSTITVVDHVGGLSRSMIITAPVPTIRLIFLTTIALVFMKEDG
ncbi:hypothetical protein F5Y02DRAFT_420611 [Annulohypoxylon stygium]|nr:hypothetical protein F5Y02DRAFT_420611 [Annulohypoxylon stygium]